MDRPKLVRSKPYELFVDSDLTFLGDAFSIAEGKRYFPADTFGYTIARFKQSATRLAAHGALLLSSSPSHQNGEYSILPPDYLVRYRPDGGWKRKSLKSD